MPKKSEQATDVMREGFSQRYVEQVLDFFIPDSQKQTSDSLLRARLLISIIQVYITILVLGLILFRLFTPLAAQYQTITSMILGFPAVLFVGILFGYRHNGNHVLWANVAVAVTYLLVFTGVSISGGPLISPATYVIPIPPLLAFCIIGRGPGFFWMSIVLATQLGLFSIAYRGYEFPFLVDASNAEINEGIDWVIAYIAIMAIAVVYETMNMRLKHERDAEHARYEFMATHDPLTDLPNRVLFHDQLNRSVLRGQRDDSHFSLLYIDLNGFKPINDQYGHEAGDKVLICVSRNIESSLREVDMVARLGGDEFAIILEGCGDSPTIDRMVRKVAGSIATPVVIGNQSVSVKASIGTATYPQDGLDGDSLVHAADQHMYTVKDTHGA